MEAARSRTTPSVLMRRALERRIRILPSPTAVPEVTADAVIEIGHGMDAIHCLLDVLDVTRSRHLDEDVARAARSFAQVIDGLRARQDRTDPSAGATALAAALNTALEDAYTVNHGISRLFALRVEELDLEVVLRVHDAVLSLQRDLHALRLGMVGQTRAGEAR
jgi:hypothetical protein